MNNHIEMSDVLLHRRRMLMQTASSGEETINGYIKRGLVFYLDGIDKGATDGTWVDLIGGAVFSVIYGTPISRDNSWYFSNKATFGANFDYLNITDYTIEVCCSIVNTAAVGGCVFYRGGQSNYPSFVERVTSGVCRIYSSCRGNTSRLYVEGKFSTLGVKIFSMAKDIIMLDMQEYVTTNRGTHDVSSSTGYTYTIGSRNTTYDVTGDIYSIRVYNRQLSLAEMLQNQQVDNERFNLGL